MSVSPDEKLTRFIRYGDHFSEVTNRVKHHAFLPKKNEVDLSVFRISGLSDTDVWTLGREHAQGEGKPIKARADLLASNVYENNLKVIADGQGHERHATITPFPIEIEATPTDRKVRRATAARLADASELRIMPTE